MTGQLALNFLTAITESMPMLLNIWTAVGGDRSAFLKALDSTLSVARAKTDTDITRKHRKP